MAALRMVIRPVCLRPGSMRQLFRSRRKGRDGAPLAPPPESRSSGDCPPRPVIPAEEADAFYNQVRSHIEGWPFDLPVPMRTKEEIERALRRGREVDEDFRLLNDLGWGEGTGGPVELTMSAEELIPILSRYRKEAAQQIASEEREEAEASADAQPHRESAALTIQMCDRVIGELSAEGGRHE